jgi:hypothetical protein
VWWPARVGCSREGVVSREGAAASTVARMRRMVAERRRPGRRQGGSVGRRWEEREWEEGDGT